MRRVLAWLLVSVAPVLTLARQAHAEPAQAPSAPAAPAARSWTSVAQPYWLGISGGVGWAYVNDPHVVTSSFVGATLGMHFGYTYNPKWAFGFDFSTIEKEVSRFGLTRNYGVDSMTKPQFDSGIACPSCPSQLEGGMPTSTMMLVAVGGPLVEFSPFGPNGWYVGATAGFAILQVVEYYGGVGGTLRTGYSMHAAEIFNLALEAGVRGQYVNGPGAVVYGMAIVRPKFNFKKKGRTFASIASPVSYH